VRKREMKKEKVEKQEKIFYECKRCKNKVEIPWKVKKEGGDIKCSFCNWSMKILPRGSIFTL
jgi:transcription elongation factor Elf1